jgi:hypothetical protein
VAVAQITRVGMQCKQSKAQTNSVPHPLASNEGIAHLSFVPLNGNKPKRSLVRNTFGYYLSCGTRHQNSLLINTIAETPNFAHIQQRVLECNYAFFQCWSRANEAANSIETFMRHCPSTSAWLFRPRHTLFEKTALQ